LYAEAFFNIAEIRPVLDLLNEPRRGKRMINKLLSKVTPIQGLVAGYVVLILIGSFALRLPIASSDRSSQNFIDSLFTATSAVSTTGLVVVDTGTFYSLFGQIIILILFQIGGLGYMAFVVLMVYSLGRRPSLVSAVTLQESLSGVTLGNMKQYLKAVFIFTFIFEGSGAVILTLYWMRHFSVSESLYLGIFHSVSAFCTSGFGLFSDSLGAYQTSWIMILVVSSISIAGGIGFIVLSDIHSKFLKKMDHVRPRQLSLHTKLSILLSVTLVVMGLALIFASESSFPLRQRIAISSFQSISASSTTGFSTIDIGKLSSTSLFIIVILMFIGASPGGSGGGIKVTAFGSMILSVWALVRGKRDITVFKRRISSDTILRSFIISLMALLWVIVVTVILTTTECTPFLHILFEVVSAIGTVGLSTGITTGLSAFGKLLIIFTMLMGRVGPLAIAFTLLGEQKPEPFRYPEGEVFIG
jgi:trk system potassium uptake protein TrkH